MTFTNGFGPGRLTLKAGKESVIFVDTNIVFAISLIVFDRVFLYYFLVRWVSKVTRKCIYVILLIQQLSLQVDTERDAKIWQTSSFS